MFLSDLGVPRSLGDQRDRIWSVTGVCVELFVQRKNYFNGLDHF